MSSSSIRLFSSFIIKAKNPCISCANYMENKYSNLYDEIYGSSNEKFGKCVLFGDQHVVTGQVTYEDATVCRKNKMKCGLDGKYYIEKKE